MRADLFIEDSVEQLKNEYFKKMLKTKKLFFQSLNKGLDTTTFLKEFSKIWNDLDYRFMNSQKQELEKIIDELNKVNLETKTKDYLKMFGKDKFDEVFDQYKKVIQKYYEGRLSTIKEINDKESYLSNFVDKYDSYQASIPYYTKEGLVHSYHNVADYSSMLFNTNLLRTAINRTMFDANYLGMDLIYIPAHNLSCPKCMEWQGRIYSLSGKDKRYPSLDEAYSNGMGHPNCKHISVIFWDNSQIQIDRFDSKEWEEKYKIDQKQKAIKREIAKKNTDLKIYKELNNQSKIDLTKKQIKKLRTRLSVI